MNKMTISHHQQDEVLSAIKAADSVLLFSHISPDGDTLGSALALKLRLERLGKRAKLYLDGDIPQSLAFLPGAASIQRPVSEMEVCDLAVAVDVSCRERLGDCEALFAAARTTAVIDHHGTNDGFGRLNMIDGEAPATAILIYRLFCEMDMPVSRDEAVCLYTALSTDTGNFIYEGTNAESFQMMAALMEAGLPLTEYSRRLFRQKEVPFVRLLGEALPSLRLSCAGRAAGIRLTLEQMERAGAKPGHTDGLVDYAIDLEGVSLAYFAREIEGGRVKVSLRALAPYRVDTIAAQFGGGGHRLASGLTLEMPIEQVVVQIEAAFAKAYGEKP